MSGEQTEINEVGPRIGQDEIAVLFDKLRYLSKGADLVVLAGSLPRDVPEDVYATMLRELRAASIPTALDAFGGALRAGLGGEPGIISPNRREAEEIVGYEFQDDSDLAGGAAALAQMGAGIVLIHDVGRVRRQIRRGKGRPDLPRARSTRSPTSSRASARGTRSSRASSPPGSPNPSPEQAVRRAVACGAANTLRLGAGVFDPTTSRRSLAASRSPRSPDPRPWPPPPPGAKRMLYA